MEKKFKDIFWFAPKSKIKAGEGLQKGRFPFYTSSQIQNKWIDTEQYFDEALIFGTGGSASVHYEDQPFSTSTDCFVTICIDKAVNTKYVYYFISTNKHIIEQGFKGAGLKHLSKKYLEDVRIPIPDIETQSKIVAILDKAKAVLNKRTKIIHKYDDLLRATFLEMFGAENPQFKDWDDIEIGKLGENGNKSFRTGPFGSSLKHDRFKEYGEVAVLGIDNAVDNAFKWKKKRFLTIGEFEEYKRYQLFPRDVIITIMGTVGRSAVVPSDIGLAINTKHLAAITLDKGKCNPYYLAYSIHSNPYINFQLKTRARGAVMDGFNLSLIKELKLKNVPIELQDRFEKIYVKCTGDIAKINLVIEKTSHLYNAIAQLAFRGELKFNTAVDLEVLLENDYAFFNENSSPQTIQLLLERLDKSELNTKQFFEHSIYDKAKNFVFQLLREGRVKQIFDEKTKQIKLTT